MWNYIVRRTLYNIPVFLAIIFVVMAALRVNDPVSAQLGKNASQDQVDLLTEEMGLDQPFIAQYAMFLRDLALIWKPIPEDKPATGAGSDDSSDEILEESEPSQEDFGTVLGGLSESRDSDEAGAETQRSDRSISDSVSPFEQDAKAVGESSSDLAVSDESKKDNKRDPWKRRETRSWDQGLPVSEMIAKAIPPSMAITIPTLVMTATIAICVGLVSAANRGKGLDRSLMFIAVIGMSISVLVYIILGQYFGAFRPSQAFEGWPFQVTVDASAGESRFFFFSPANWISYCMLPVMINVVVALGYDTRFYRAVMVEESQRDYIRTARAKGASRARVMFVHMLKNAMIPIITRIMISLPFIITGSILVEVYFGIPGMGRTLINAINSKDFPVIQTFTALFTALFIASNILTDVLYALVDPRVRLQ